LGLDQTKNCWDGIEHFRTWGQKVSNVIEGDIKEAYDCVNHEILLRILSKRIKDKNFLNLIKKMQKAGIMDEGK
jgi:retron-type reverse transcriptase